MCYTVMHGSGHMFGPYFLNDGKSFNGVTYRAMLTDLVFPDMTRLLGMLGSLPQFGSRCILQVQSYN